MRMEEVDYDNFLEDVPKPQKKELEEIFEEKKEELDEEEIRKKLKDGLSDEREHRDLVRAVASAFHQHPEAEGRESGYVFAFTEPLEEFNVSNGDVLLVKEEGNGLKLCLAECKSGSNYPSWINHIDRIKQELEDKEHLRALKAQLGYREKDVDFIQHILVTKAPNAADVDLDDMGKNVPEELTVWAVDQSSNRLFRNSSRTGNDPDLGSVMGDGGVDYGRVENPIEYTIGSHPVIVLEDVIFRLIRSKRSKGKPFPEEFNEEEFYDKFEEKLQMGVGGSKKQEIIRETVNDILHFGEEIGILSADKSDLKSNKDYRIMFKGDNPDIAEEAVEEKFLKNRPIRKLSREAFKEAVEEYDGFQKQKGIDEFSNKSS